MQKTAGLITESQYQEKINKNLFTSAALDLVDIAKSMTTDNGFIDDLDPEEEKAQKIKTADELSDFYYILYNLLVDIAEDSIEFPKKAKDIIVNKYKLSITDEYGRPMKFI
jgi:hypothetical protein